MLSLGASHLGKIKSCDEANLKFVNENIAHTRGYFHYYSNSSRLLAHLKFPFFSEKTCQNLEMIYGNKFLKKKIKEQNEFPF